MKEEIINRVANSGLITIDLSNYAPKYCISELDIKEFLFEGVVLKEKEFRLSLKRFDFEKYKNEAVALFCSTNAIVPMWAYMLISSYLKEVCCRIHCGEKEKVFQNLILSEIKKINVSEFKDKKVIVKGCGSIPLDASLYIAITEKLQENVSSLMFGEACSAVPVYKKKK